MRRSEIAPRIMEVFLLLGAMSSLLMAGGPTSLAGEGEFFRWDPNEPVLFTVDRGDLGMISNEKAAEIVLDAAEGWNGVMTSTLKMQDNGNLDRDITVDNYEEFFGMGPGQQPLLRPENPIIFDDDGSITDDLLGPGSSNSVLGFAGVRFVDEGSFLFLSAWAVLNGRNARATGQFPKTVAHEIGHFLGLDHSQGLLENFEASFQFGEHVPLMFPLGFFVGPGAPIKDDATWYSWMYPAEDFGEGTGTIRGRVFRRSGAPLQGANVVAQPVTVGDNGTITPQRENIVSVVSDFLAKGTGEYELPNLAPGDYIVFIEPIDPDFTEGSGVGPFDIRPSGFPRDYWNSGESATDITVERDVITVEAGVTIENIDFIANETINRLDLLEDDDEMPFFFPEGFTFPFYGEVYESVVVNSDGNLTFGVGDAQPGAARTVTRFLTGPPRIAPFFSDLDPATGGRVLCEIEKGRCDEFDPAEDAVPEWVRFLWSEVPEFSETGTQAPNTFSVTLFRDGSIEFFFEEISATPDSNLLAVVGISPGEVLAGSERNLSDTQEIPLTEDAIFERFLGTSFDLTGTTLRFQSSGEMTETFDLFFPYLQGDGVDFSGYALTNFGDVATELTAEARDDAGDLRAYPENPSTNTVSANSQFARLGRELFDLGAESERQGWIRIASTEPEVASFFQFGNGLQGSLSRLDGSVAFGESFTKLYLTRIFDGMGVFPSLSGGQDAQTRVAIVNPHDVAIEVVVRFFNRNGNRFGPRNSRTIEPRGRIFDTVAGLINESRVLGDGFIEIEVVDGPGAIAFEIIELADTLIALNAETDPAPLVRYSAQLGHGGGIFTSLKLVNTSEAIVSVTLTAFVNRQDGGIDELARQVTLGARQSLQQDVSQIFGFPQQTDQPISGSIVVEATNPGVIGDVIFGDPQSIRFAAALSLQSALFTRAINSQVSNGRSKSDPALNSFTGLAFFNPGDEEGTVEVEVFRSDGTPVGSTEILLDSGARISRTVVELVPESEGQIGGFIEISSSVPIVAQQLFGNEALDYLSAVPPAIIE